MVDVYGRAVVGQQGLPVLRQEAALLRDGINIVCERQRDDIGLQADDHRTGLLSRTVVRLIDRDVVARFGFPRFRKGGVDLLIKFPRWIIGDVQQLDICGIQQTAGQRQNYP